MIESNNNLISTYRSAKNENKKLLQKRYETAIEQNKKLSQDNYSTVKERDQISGIENKLRSK